VGDTATLRPDRLLPDWRCPGNKATDQMWEVGSAKPLPWRASTRRDGDKMIVMAQEYPFEASPAVKEMMRTIATSTSVIYWHSDGGPVSHNGSMFFLDTRKALFGVTARHVYEGYLESDKAEPMICRIGNLVIDPKERLIGMGTHLDIATFHITRQELAELGNITVP
jgi:hypothetical protein